MNDNIIEVKDDGHLSEIIKSNKATLDDNKSTKNDNFVLIDFWAEWCGPCKVLMPHIEKLSGSHKEKITICKLNIDKVQETALSYNVRSIPTLIIFKNGKEVARKIGGCDFKTLVEWVDSEIEK